ncbi:MAG: HD domain-containing protein [Candidatus Lokiarchaeota archaeon]|nr:HD domain-containing protein [Candidatus Lokiarchaeota archaeon]
MYRKINDPIFGLIELSKVESLIVDTPIFQRLRYIKQLALANYIYPCANHDRFSHCLGVFYLTDKICDVLNKKNQNLLDSYSISNLKMAALLHDLGHSPFSHALEFYRKKDEFDIKQFPFFFRIPHEEFSTYLIKNSYLKDLLLENGYDVNLICNLIEGNDIENLILSRIINWELDSDRLDYILRDSYFTGVGFGNINYHYLLNSFNCYNNKRIVIDSKAIRDIEHFIISRFSLHDRVYTHKTGSYFTYMLTYSAYYSILNEYFLPFRSKKELNEIISDKEHSKKFLEFSDFYLFGIFYRIYQKLKESKREEDINLSRIFEAVIYRKKNFKIKKYSIFTSKSESETDILKYRIKNHLDTLINEYPNEIFVHTPKNVFTKYLSTKIPSSGLTNEIEEKFKEEEEQTIWIQEKDKIPEIFYRTNETFFRKIHDFGITKVLIYINKENNELIKKFNSIELKIKKLIYNS